MLSCNISLKNVHNIGIKDVLKRLVRSSHRRCFVRKDVLRNFAKFTGKHLCQSPFFNKVADLRRADLLPATSRRKITTLSQIFQNYAKLLFPAIYFEKIFQKFLDINLLDLNI